MTIDQCIAKVIAAFDEAKPTLMHKARQSLLEHGDPTAEEMENHLRWYEQWLQEDLAAHLVRVRAWLSRGGQTLQ
jgi:hypothetical protein